MRWLFSFSLRYTRMTMTNILTRRGLTCITVYVSCISFRPIDTYQQNKSKWLVHSSCQSRVFDPVKYLWWKPFAETMDIFVQRWKKKETVWWYICSRHSFKSRGIYLYFGRPHQFNLLSCRPNWPWIFKNRLRKKNCIL